METLLDSDTVKAQERITTISLTKNEKNGEYFRYIKSTDSTFDAEMGFTDEAAARRRYKRDLDSLKGITPPSKTTYGPQKLNFKDYIAAVVDERIMTQAIDEMHEHAVDMINNTPGIAAEDEKKVDQFITKAELAMVDAMISQLEERSERLKEVQ